MKHKKKKKKGSEHSELNAATAVAGGMPPASAVAAERAREAAYERALAALAARRGAADGAGDGSDSCASDDEARVLSALRPLRQGACVPAPPPSAAALLPPLAAALRAAHAPHVAFLDRYRRLLADRTDAELQHITDELMRCVEEGLAAGDGAGVVLACWLGAALAWRAPRVYGAASALHCVLQRLTADEVEEAARALHAALEARALVAVSDAVRGAGRAGAALAALLLRGALARLAGAAPDWGARGAVSADEVRAALARGRGRGRRARAGDAAALALALAGRALGPAPRSERAALMRALAPPPPPPHNAQDPDYLKACVALKTLQQLFKQ